MVRLAKTERFAYRRPESIALWKRLPADSTVEEGARDFLIRQPVLWLEKGKR
jgi:hypothetical protein